MWWCREGGRGGPTPAARCGLKGQADEVDPNEVLRSPSPGSTGVDLISQIMIHLSNLRATRPGGAETCIGSPFSPAT